MQLTALYSGHRTIAGLAGGHYAAHHLGEQSTCVCTHVYVWVYFPT